MIPTKPKGAATHVLKSDYSAKIDHNVKSLARL